MDEKTETTNDDYISGRFDGTEQAKGKFIYFLFGLLLSLLGVLIALFYQEKPNQSMLEGKSKAYILGFTEAYQSKSRNKNVVLTILGCMLSFAIFGIFQC